MPNTVNPKRIVGNSLVVGGVNARPGSITVKGSIPGANDASVVIEGALIVQSLIIPGGIGSAFDNSGIGVIYGDAGTPVTTVNAALNHVQPFMRRALIRPTDLVTGQPNTYYIDKGATARGFNVAYDSIGEPMIRVLVGGVERFWGPVGQFGVPDSPADFDIVRSQSTGAEGFAPSGSKNAIQFNGAPGQTIWIYYHQRSQA